MEGIPVGEALGELKCPPPVTPFYSELCAAPACLHHNHCPPTTACCFNGCVHTCLSQVDDPAVIDWLEDTSVILPILEESAPPKLPIRYEETNLQFAEGGGEAVNLPGGCTISGMQYTQLQDFMKAPSIDDCRCSQGEVVCAIKVFKS
ncbi:WAP four-disulfide core domain protein 1, partial [Halocaridina rubra]